MLTLFFDNWSFYHYYFEAYLLEAFYTNFKHENIMTAGEAQAHGLQLPGPTAGCVYGGRTAA